MDVIRTIRPGKPGSRRFQRRFGQRLVAVHYRLDRDSRRLFTTVELIVDRRNQSPPGVSYVSVLSDRNKQPVAVPIAWKEQALRKHALSMGARWSRLHRVWIMRYDTAVTLGMQQRIIEGLAERCEDVDWSIGL